MRGANENIYIVQPKKLLLIKLTFLLDFFKAKCIYVHRYSKCSNEATSFISRLRTSLPYLSVGISYYAFEMEKLEFGNQDLLMLLFTEYEVNENLQIYSDLSRIAFVNFWDIGHVKITCYMQITFSPKNEISNYFQVEIMFGGKKISTLSIVYNPLSDFFLQFAVKRL